MVFSTLVTVNVLTLNGVFITYDKTEARKVKVKLMSVIARWNVTYGTCVLCW
jgi:hypothetical protein